MPRIIWGPGWLESLSLLLGAWSCPTMVIPSDQLSITYFCKWFFIIAFASMLFSWFVFSLLLSDFFYVDKPLFSDSADEFDSPLIRGPSARFDFLLSSYYGVNRRSLTQLDFQLQVVNTGSSYNPETISPVWFDYKSPVLYMVNPVYFTTRHGFIINRHNMEGVISTQDWDCHPYYKKLVKPTMWFNVTGMIYFIFDYF